jgi:hypothetical protein
MKFVGPHEIQVGPDGVRLSRLHGERFVPYAQIKRVELTALSVVLHLDGEERVELHVWTGSGDDSADLRALADTLDRGRAGAKTEPTEAERLLEKSDRSVREWVGYARNLGRSGSDYRTGASARDELWRVVEDPAALEEARVGAALALGSSADDHARLRAVAEESVSPRVRIAIDAAAEEDDDVVAEKLDAQGRHRAG